MMQRTIRIAMEGDSAGGMREIGEHLITMLQGCGWSYRVRLPMADPDPGKPRAYATRALNVPESIAMIDVDCKVIG